MEKGERLKCNADTQGHVCQRREGETSVGLIRINYLQTSGKQHAKKKETARLKLALLQDKELIQHAGKFLGWEWGWHRSQPAKKLTVQQEEKVSVVLLPPFLLTQDTHGPTTTTRSHNERSQGRIFPHN